MSGPSRTVSIPPKSSRPYDIILWGATGFTGELVAQQLAKEYPSLRWALAGRDTKKLETVRAKLPNADNVKLLSASLSDEASLGTLASSTRVIISTVGPYVLHGEPVLKACVTYGTDYVDITGETGFSLHMMTKYEEEAKRTGAAVVSFCGYDSIPSDLGAYFVAQQLKQLGTEATQVHGLFQLSGRASGGTFNTIMTAMSNPSAVRDARYPRAINPDETKVTLPAERDQLWLRWDEDAKTWTVPFLMALTNTRVVRRSIGILGGRPGSGYGRNMTYNESMPVPNLLAGIVTLLGLGLFALLLAFSWGRAILKLFIPAPGQGPDAAARAKSKFKTTLIGTGANGTKVTCVVRGGDPSCTATPCMVLECGTLFATSRDSLPLAGASSTVGTAGTRGGFLTPATAFGDVLIQRLHEKGITFTREK